MDDSVGISGDIHCPMALNLTSRTSFRQLSHDQILRSHFKLGGKKSVSYKIRHGSEVTRHISNDGKYTYSRPFTRVHFGK